MDKTTTTGRWFGKTPAMNHPDGKAIPRTITPKGELIFLLEGLHFRYCQTKKVYYPAF